MLKKWIRITAVFLSITTLLGIVFISSAADISGTKTNEIAKYDALVSVVSCVVTSTGNTLGPNTAHGGNQNRIVSVTGASYVGVLTNKDMDGEHGEGEFGLFQVKDDGSIRCLVTSVLVGANINGVTVTVMADENENIWAYSGWDDYNSSFVSNLWFYDTKADQVTHYIDSQVFTYGGSYGYSVASIDLAKHKIYATICGGATPGWMVVKGFDYHSLTWDKMTAYKLPSRAQYCEGFTDDLGNLIVVANRGPSFRYTKANTGETVADAIERLHNQKTYNNYTFDSVYVEKITDPDSQERVSKNISLIDVETPVYDVEKGLYPQINHYWQGDVFKDSKGKLHVLYSSDDNNGIAGSPLKLKTFDLHDDLKEIASGEVKFLYGFNCGYTARWFEDTKGHLFLIATMNSGKIEVWMADNEEATSFTFIHEFNLPGIYDQGAIVMANDRNNSTKSDVATFLLLAKDTQTDVDDWCVVKIDLGKTLEMKGID